jgi:hypothetical protein
MSSRRPSGYVSWSLAMTECAQLSNLIAHRWNGSVLHVPLFRPVERSHRKVDKFQLA